MITDNESASHLIEGLFFLEIFGYVITESVERVENEDYLLINYTSELHKKRIEIVLGLNKEYIDILIRRKLESWAGYNDEKNCIGINDLAHLLKQNDYNEEDYSFNIVGIKKVIANALEVLHLSRSILCSSDWFNWSVLEKIKSSYYQKKFNVDISLNKDADNPSAVLKKATAFLLKDGYKLVQDSDDLPPFRRSVWFIKYTNGLNTITIRQSDWRDSYYIFQLLFNESIVAEFDSTKYQTIEVLGSRLKYLIKESS